MAWLINQILALLSSDAGNLTYHLVIAFSIASSLQIAIHQNLQRSLASNRRMILGLALMLALQAAQFIAAGFAWQGLLDAHLWFPLLERVITLLDLVIIIWMWVLPKPNATGDAAALALGVLTVAGSAFLVTWWSKVNFIPSAPLTDNLLNAISGSSVDVYMQAVSLAFLTLGILFLAARRPAGWGFGFTMLAILAVGHAAQLISPARGGDYPVILHLLQMSAFPFLLILPQRAFLQEKGETPAIWQSAGAGGSLETRPESELLVDSSMMGLDSQIIRTLLGLMEDLSETQACRRIAAILASMTQADFVSIVTPADADGLIHVLCGYERSTKHYIESSAVEASSLPILNSCLKLGRMRRLAASSSSPDRQAVQKLYDFDRVGAMLFVPVISAEGNPLSGAVIVAEDYEKDWTVEEQEKIGLIVKFLILYLSQAQEMAKIHSDLTLSRRSAIFVHEQAQQVYDEQRKLRDTITVLKEQSLQDKYQNSTISLEVEDQVALQQTIQHLQMDNQRLALAIDQAEARSAQSRRALEAELKLTLEEISLLRSALEGGEPTSGNSGPSAALPKPSETQLERLSVLVEDLRRPLASMTGYTELLLDESSAALTGTQREYLERIRQSTGRFNQLLDELSGEAILEPAATHVESILVDARDLIGEVLQAVGASFKQRRIDLRVQLPDHELPVLTDPAVLRRVILLLLENAAAVTPEEGRAGISAWLEQRETDRGYLFIQVQDQGGGFPLHEIPQLFMSRLKPRSSRDIGEGSAGLFRLKTTLEQMGGRIWVESEPEIGLIFSILFPAAFIPEIEPRTEEPA